MITALFTTLGAELTSLRDDSQREYIWQADPEYWAKHSPVLFPIVGTLKNNTYLFNGKSYNLPRHGFAREKEFTVKAQTDTSIVFSLLADEKSLEAYPFRFELEITYALEEKTLRIDYRISNLSEGTMPFSIGAHPAFALSGDFSNYSLKFSQPESPAYSLLDGNGLVSKDKNLLPIENGILSLNYGLFENDALIFKTLESRSLEILENDIPILEIGFEKFPHLGLWTMQNAPFLCIEPWQGYADVSDHNGNISDKEGIINLPEGKDYNLGFSIKITG